VIVRRRFGGGNNAPRQARRRKNLPALGRRQDVRTHSKPARTDGSPRPRRMVRRADGKTIEVPIRRPTPGDGSPQVTEQPANRRDARADILRPCSEKRWGHR